MATYNPRRFANPDALKTIRERYLLRLLSRYRAYFSGRGVELPAEGSDGLDYEALVGVLIDPDDNVPTALVDALYHINEMATHDGMDELLTTAEESGVLLEVGPSPTPADVAVQVWLQDQNLLERKHAEQFLTKRRSFESFLAGEPNGAAFQMPDSGTLQALREDLDEWFEKKKRGRTSRVFVYPRDDGVWFLVRHGQPFRREGSVREGESSSVYFRPETHDVLVYDPEIEELRINAESKGARDLYLEKFGLRLFGEKNHFPSNGKYTLAPLRAAGKESLVCSDVEGMEWVKLKEIRYFWGGPEKEVEVRKAEDIFAALERRERRIPARARIIYAGFAVKFADSKTPRTVSIRPPNSAQYTRDDDSAIVEDWLLKREFIASRQEEKRADAETALAGA